MFSLITLWLPSFSLSSVQIFSLNFNSARNLFLGGLVHAFCRSKSFKILNQKFTDFYLYIMRRVLKSFFINSVFKADQKKIYSEVLFGNVSCIFAELLTRMFWLMFLFVVGIQRNYGDPVSKQCPECMLLWGIILIQSCFSQIKVHSGCSRRCLSQTIY